MKSQPMSPSTQSDPRVSQIVEALLSPRRRDARPSSVRYEEVGTLRSSVGPIAYWSTGHGPAVLLVHGWEGTHADLDAFVEPLLARGARVVTLDLPAHGESFGTQASLPDFATALAELGAEVGPMAGVVAHSVGCPATALAISRGLETQRAVLVSTPTRYERWAREFASEAGVDPDAVVGELIARGIDVPSLDMAKNVAEFTLPALIVHSQDDRVTDALGSRTVSEAWRGSRLHYVDGLGHSRILRDPAVVAEAVDFLFSKS
jgi:pimeloyl-ACP methyl ester carboxylesterase